jgi:hypothetical protein
MRPTLRIFVGCLSLTAALCASHCAAQATVPRSSADEVLAAAAAAGQHTFLVFHKDREAKTQAMVAAVRKGVEARSNRATFTLVNVAEPRNAALATRLGVDRAPMPLTLVLAPNGAVTGAYPQRISEEHIAGSFATPALATCLKSLQDGKLVFACFQPAVSMGIPQGVQEFQADPQFQPRVEIVPVRMDDPAEAEFVAQLKLNPKSLTGTTAFFAPPGMLVGKFNDSATAADLGAALHKAGKCCNDPNCKHNKAQQSQPPAGNQDQASQRRPTRN